jgi:hypothetical protein
MNLILNIPSIPFDEAKIAINHFIKEIKIKEHEFFIWKDGFAIFWQQQDVLIKGPKLNNNMELDLWKNNENYQIKELTLKKFIEKYSLNNKDEIYMENNYIYVKITPKLDILKCLKNIPWLKPMKMNGDFITRPLESIYISKDLNIDYKDSIIENNYCGILPEVKNFTVNEFKEFYRKKNIIVSIEEKLSNCKIEKNFTQYTHSTSNPYVIFIPLKEKYKYIPSGLIDFIIGYEQRVVSVYNGNEITGFNFILDKKIENINIDNFSIVIDGRLEDLAISYERDKKNVFFDNKYKDLEWEHITSQLIEFWELNLDKNKIKFILENYNNDFNTTIVEEYPSLLGYLSYICYINQKDYDVNIGDGLGAFSELANNKKNSDYEFLIYMSKNINFLINLSKNNNLATSTKDPFTSKQIIDKLLLKLIDLNKDLPLFIIEDKYLKDLFQKRLEIYIKKKYKFKLKVENLTIKNINYIINFLNINYERLISIVNRIKYFVNKEKVSTTPLINNYPLEEKLLEIEYLLNNEIIENNIKYIEIISLFFEYINNILDL